VNLYFLCLDLYLSVWTCIVGVCICFFGFRDLFAWFLDSCLVCILLGCDYCVHARGPRTWARGPWIGKRKRNGKGNWNGFEAGVRALIERGANPRLRNRWGDTPGQLFMFRRPGAAAAAARQPRQARARVTEHIIG